jgi:hypothetical protein
MDRIENNTSKNISIVARVFVAAGTYLLYRHLATAVFSELYYSAFRLWGDHTRRQQGDIVSLPFLKIEESSSKNRQF